MSLFATKRALFTSVATASVAGAFYYTYSPSRYAAAPTKMLPAYEATFSVALECDECVKDISSALEKLPGKLTIRKRQSIQSPTQLFQSSTSIFLYLALRHYATEQHPRYPIDGILHPYLYTDNDRHHAPLGHNISHPIHRPPRYPTWLRSLQQRRCLHS